MSTESFKVSKVKIVFPFKYDLGGEIDKFQKAKEKLLVRYPNLKVDERSLESFNLSYLSIREPTLTLEKEKIGLVLEGKEYQGSQTIKLYASSGIISIILSFELEDLSSSELIEFYKCFVKEKQKEYIPYLKQHGCHTKALLEAIKVEVVLQQLKFGQIADELRLLLKHEIKARPYTYCFHDFRTLFLIFDDFSEQDIAKHSEALYDLLRLTKRTGEATEDMKSLVSQSKITYENRFILSGDWASVFLLNGDHSFEEDAVMLFDLAHSFWYICQTWIFILDYILTHEFVDFDKSTRVSEISQKSYEKMIEMSLKLHDYIVSVHQSLLEVKNVDLMFKNPEFCKIMKKIYSSMGIPPHIELLEHNLLILDSHHQRLKDTAIQKLSLTAERQSRKTASGMQILSLIFSGSVGLSVALMLQSAGLVSGFSLVAAGLVLWAGIAGISITLTNFFTKSDEK